MYILLSSLLQRLPPFRRIGAIRIHVHDFIDPGASLGKGCFFASIKTVMSWNGKGGMNEWEPLH
jgi:hypothetical protein